MKADVQVGWIVRVEHPEGALLFGARVLEPLEAEDLVRRLCQIPAGRDVYAWKPMTLAFADDLQVAEGSIRGPF